MMAWPVGLPSFLVILFGGTIYLLPISSCIRFNGPSSRSSVMVAMISPSASGIAHSVNKDDFSELFKSCYLVTVRTNREQKLQAATAILANLLLRPSDPAKSSYEELDHLIRCIDALSIGAITVLGAARTIAATSGQGA